MEAEIFLLDTAFESTFTPRGEAACSFWKQDKAKNAHLKSGGSAFEGNSAFIQKDPGTRKSIIPRAQTTPAQRNHG